MADFRPDNLRKRWQRKLERHRGIESGRSRETTHLEVVGEVEMREDVDEAQALWPQPRGDSSEQLLVVLHMLQKARPRISIATQKVQSEHFLVVAHDLLN
jgi:hypothetical protein